MHHQPLHLIDNTRSSVCIKYPLLNGYSTTQANTQAMEDNTAGDTESRVCDMCAAYTVGSTGSIPFALDGFGYLLILISHFVLLFVQVELS